MSGNLNLLLGPKLPLYAKNQISKPSIFFNQLGTCKQINIHIRIHGVCVIATSILHEISLLIGELAIRGTKLTLNAGLGTEDKLLIEQYYIMLLEQLLSGEPEMQRSGPNRGPDLNRTGPTVPVRSGP